MRRHREAEHWLRGVARHSPAKLSQLGVKVQREEAWPLLAGNQQGRRSPVEEGTVGQGRIIRRQAKPLRWRIPPPTERHAPNAQHTVVINAADNGDRVRVVQLVRPSNKRDRIVLLGGRE